MFKKKNKKPKLIVKEGLEKYDSEMNERYANREDTGNIFGVGITDYEFVSYIKDIILGPDWYTVAPLGKNQVNEEILESVISVLMTCDDIKRNRNIIINKSPEKLDFDDIEKGDIIYKYNTCRQSIDEYIVVGFGDRTILTNDGIEKNVKFIELIRKEHMDDVSRNNHIVELTQNFSDVALYNTDKKVLYNNRLLQLQDAFSQSVNSSYKKYLESIDELKKNVGVTKK